MYYRTEPPPIELVLKQLEERIGQPVPPEAEAKIRAIVEKLRSQTPRQRWLSSLGRVIRSKFHF
jgi:hypothetical protein